MRAEAMPDAINTIQEQRQVNIRLTPSPGGRMRIASRGAPPWLNRQQLLTSIRKTWFRAATVVRNASPWATAGASSLVQDLRTRGLLRRFEEPSCTQAFLKAHHAIISSFDPEKIGVVLADEIEVFRHEHEIDAQSIADKPPFSGRKAQMFPQLSAAQIARWMRSARAAE